MPKVPLQSMTLNMLSDGFTGRVIEENLATIVKDMIDRGRDGKTRTLAIAIDFTPADQGKVQVDVKVGSKLPPWRPVKTIAQLDERAGGLLFNTDCAANPDQQTFADYDGDK